MRKLFQKKNENEAKTSVQKTEGPDVKLPFYRSWIPWKGDSRGEIIRKTVCLVALCVFVVSASMLVWQLVIEPAQADKTTNDIKKIYYQNTASTPGSSSGTKSAPPQRDASGRLIKFVNLQKVNPDIKGWVQIPNTVIDYPVLQSSSASPEYYLKRDYNKSYTKYGSIFLDARCNVLKPAATQKNDILYGHSMQDGRMFAALLNFGQMNVYKASPVITFDTVTEPSQWKIISVFKTNTNENQGKLFDYLKTEFKSDSVYMNFIYQMRIRSIIQTPVDFIPSDDIITLSTCSYEFDDFRTVVVARRVRSGETTTVDTQKAQLNAKVLYPDCWYKKNGGKAPKWPDTYEQAKSQGLIDWAAK
jgi:sortase B